ncbi:subtilisin-like protein [Leucogyrophana mollusca]|uniref:Subtilisin-like protein n=1 Tax=Leucogyrophana mollusca TaxID=85980 RepID=A0ACB8BL86_9AGAM|nr:subtilisin-like protein [Leucogyrophana mollusca]
MFLFLPALTVLAVVLGLQAHGEATASPYVVHEMRTHAAAGWSLVRRHSPSALILLRFALAQSNIAEIGSHLNDVSHPDSPNYGKHWSAGKIAETFAPSNETVAAVQTWLLESGIFSNQIRVTPTKGWIEVNATVEEAEQLLHAEYSVYRHDTGKEHIALQGYSLPAHIRRHVDFVTPTIHFDAKISSRSPGTPWMGSYPKTTGVVNETSQGLENCDSQITPECLRALYGIAYKPAVPHLNSYGIVEYTPQSYRQDDINKFAASYSPDLSGISPVLTSIDGGVIQTDQESFNLNGESDLDLQYAMALVSAKQPLTLYQAGDLQEGASFNNFLDALDGSYCTFEGGDDPADPTYPDSGGYAYHDCGTVKPANVISTSYSYTESDLSSAYTARQCAEYAKLGLMGVTMLFSSGDYGVAGNGGACMSYNGTYGVFNPMFPSTCPYVTSVGATQINTGASVYDPESACERVIYSGGGFSNYFAVPSYQEEVVHNYLTNHPPPYDHTIWNATGNSRAFPDVSANGANYVVAIDGQFSLVYGTSASSPVVGAMLTLVNDARLAKGKAPIGFINPAIYSSAFAKAFNDISSGSNSGCDTTGFASASGWDPVTGLGTPNFPSMLEAWMALP